jgi:hypothetical protein
MVTVTGRITRGLGYASGNLSTQMRHFIPEYPELERCHHGTINVILDSQLEIISPDRVLGPFKWSATFPPEKFGFLKIRFESPDAKIDTEAWIYIPYLSPHRIDPCYVEVLAPELNLGRSTNCRLLLPAKKIMV